MPPPNLEDVLSADDSDGSALDSILDTPEPAATNDTSAFDEQMADHASALGSAVHGVGATVPEADPAAQRDGEPEWNFNMRTYGSGFKPEAYDPTSLMNINDDPVYQATRIAEDKSLGIFKPIAYDPSSLMHINDSPTTRAVNSFASGGETPGAEQQQPASKRRDMRFALFPESNPNPVALPGPYPAPDSLSPGPNRVKKKNPYQSTEPIPTKPLPK